MRSFILSAAIAAVLASTSFTLAQAASSGGGRSVGNSSTGASRGMGDTSTNGGKGVGETGGEPDWGAPATILPQAFSMVRPEPRLEQIKAQLNDAASRIAEERRHGALTPSAARTVRQEETSISEAVQNIADRGNGAVGDATYARLENRISHLDRMIERYATHA